MPTSDLPNLHKHEEEFYKWMGLCISRWAYTEDVLFGLTQIVLGIPKEFISVIYYRTPQLSSRLALVKELMEVALPKHQSGEHKHPLVKQLESVIKALSDLLPIRNALAHHRVRNARRIPIYDDDGRVVNAPHELLVAMSDNEAERGKYVEPVSLSDMKAHYPKIEDARHHFMEFQAAYLVWRLEERLRQSQTDRSH